MFQFPRLPLLALCVQARVTGHYPSRVPPFGNLRFITVKCTSPQLIAAYHVLHRLPMPRHPPCALNIFIHQVKDKKIWVFILIRDRKMRITINNFSRIEESYTDSNLYTLCNYQGARKSRLTRTFQGFENPRNRILRFRI